MAEAGFELSVAQTEAFDRGVSAATVRVPVPAGRALDPAATVRALMNCWEILRTRFPNRTGAVHPLQVVSDPPGEAADLDPQWSLVLETGDGGGSDPVEAALVLSAPEVVADHRSLELLAAMALDPAGLPADPLQFADIAGWEAEQRAQDTPERRSARAFWGEAPTIAPAARRDPAASGIADLADVADVGSAPPEAWTLAWLLVLQRNELLPVDAPTVAVSVSGRSAPELVDAIGPLTRYVPVGFDVDSAASAADAMVRVARTLEQAERHAVYAPSGPAVAGIDFLPATAVAPSARPGLAAQLQVRGETRATVAVHGGRPGLAQRLAGHLGVVLDGLLTAPATPAASLPLLTPPELQALAAAQDGGAAEGSAFPIPAGGPTLVATFAAVAAARPDAVAVADGTQQLTFAELDAASDAAARGLRGRLGGPQPVGVLVDRSVHSVVALLAVLKTGGCFQPVDAALPAPRVDAQLVQGGCRSLLVPAGSGAGSDGLSVTAVALLRLADLIEQGVSDQGTSDQGTSEPGRGPEPGPDEVAYQISTSGSTGAPKIVAIRHRNAVAYTLGVCARLGLHEGDRLGALTSLSTDLAYTMMFPTFVVGSALRLFAADLIGDLPKLAAVVDRERLAALKLTPSHLRALFGGPDGRLEVPLLVLGGEALDPATVAEARRRGATRVVNHYGPTETTVGAVTYEAVAADDATARQVPIGRALPGVRTYVLDAALRPVPWGVTGQLAIGGVGVGAGYVGSPTLSEERFRSLPDAAPDPVYLTGDLVRLDDAGRLLFLGRDDDQVKIRGFRVELEEVATVLREHPGLTDAVAVVDPTDVEADRILAYVVAGAAVPPEADVRAWVAARLPSYMVPARAVILSAMPRTASGKIDRLALPEVPAGTDADDGIEAPVGDVEEQLLEIWREVLDLGRLGVTDDFFLVGGHSLLATRIIARARAQFGLELPLHLMFTHPTVRTMAEQIDTQRGVEADGSDELTDLMAVLDQLSEDEARDLLDRHRRSGDPSR